MTRHAIILTALVLSLFAASAANAARTEFFGIHQRGLDLEDRQGIEAARVKTVRFMLGWRSVEPSRGSYDWRATDRFVGALASRGIRAVPFAWGSPEWVGKLGQPPTSAADEQAWQNFLKAAVARYRPGGSYWANEYHQRFGADAKPLPIKSWQVWNEPNLGRYFSAGQTVQQSARKYARLLEISHDAIESQDQQARIVLAGMPGYGDSTAWGFLRNLYQIPGTKGDFDAAALNPYACDVAGVRGVIVQFRAAMKAYADGATPLWLTELAWGSDPPDQFCINKGLGGQAELLGSSFSMILSNRWAWNVQRLYWFLWRDPEPGARSARLCSFCGTAGLLRYDRTPKPAYNVFRSFTAETTPPRVTITSGPSYGSVIKDPTPTFSFASNEPGSTFFCRLNAQSFSQCSSPFTRSPPLPDGAHTFYVKAIDAPGNESAVRSRSFTVDTTPPQTTITSGPSGPTADATPTYSFTSSQSGSIFRCRFDSQPFAACSGPGASHTPSSRLSDGSHSFEVRATDPAGNSDRTPATRTFTVAGRRST